MTAGWVPGAHVVCVVPEDLVIAGDFYVDGGRLTGGVVYTLASAPYNIDGMEVVALEEARSRSVDGGFLKARFRLVVAQRKGANGGVARDVENVA